MDSLWLEWTKYGKATREMLGMQEASSATTETLSALPSKRLFEMNRRGFFGLFPGLLGIRAIQMEQPRLIAGGPSNIHPGWAWEAAQEMAVKLPGQLCAVSSQYGLYEVRWVPKPPKNHSDLST